MVAVFVVSILLAGVFSGATRAVQANYAAAQRTAAFGLCKERLEQMRGTDFDRVSEVNFPTGIVQITHLGGSQRIPLTGFISNSIVSQVSPPRKEVTVTVWWECRGRTLQESYSGSVVDREAIAGVLGSVNGWVNLHPNRTWPRRFELWKSDGTTIDMGDLQDAAFTGYNGIATKVRYWAGGGDTQTTLQHNFQPYPMANAKRWKTEGNALQVNLYKNAGNKWCIDITGIDSTISTY
jgi:type II secretory pathway pseudopilin PulG